MCSVGKFYAFVKWFGCVYRAGLRKCRYVLKMMSREVPPADLAMPWLPTAQTGPRNMLQNSYQNIATLTQPLSVKSFKLSEKLLLH